MLTTVIVGSLSPIYVYIFRNAYYDSATYSFIEAVNTMCVFSRWNQSDSHKYDIRSNYSISCSHIRFDNTTCQDAQKECQRTTLLHKYLFTDITVSLNIAVHPEI